MFPVYEEKKKNLHIHLRTSAHASPHLHNFIEFIYITEGTLELGMGQELYHMEKGDFAGAGASGYCKCGTVSQGKPQGEG